MKIARACRVGIRPRSSDGLGCAITKLDDVV